MELWLPSLSKLALLIGIATLGWLLAFGIRKWFSKKCRWAHKQKYVKLDLYTNWRCPKPGHSNHLENEWWATAATWVCDEPGCNAHGVDCMGTKGWWKIEHGQVMLDEKQMASPPADIKSPKVTLEERRAKKQELTKPVHIDEAMQLLVDLAVLAKKGQIGPSEPGGFTHSQVTVTGSPEPKPEEKK